MTSRVTDSQTVSAFLNNIGRTHSRMSELQQQLSSGRAFATAADDPFTAGRVVGIDAQLQEIKQFQENVTDSLGVLGVEDSALDSIGGSLQRVRDLVQQAVNGTVSDTDRTAIATEIQQLKETIRSSANVRYGNTYLFGGTNTTTAPFPAPGNMYVGTSTLMTRRVAPDQQVTVNLDGSSIFGTTTGLLPSEMSTFDMLDQIVSDLTVGGTAGIDELRTDGLNALSAHIDNVLEQRSNLGATAAKLEQTQQQLADMEDRMTSTRTKLADADMAKAYMEYQSQSTMYQSALAAGARMMKTSLLDFL